MTASLIRARVTASGYDPVLVHAELTTLRCRWCTEDVEHCHEALVVHPDGAEHCCDDGCTTPAELHHLVVRCADIGCRCTEHAEALG